MTTPLRGRERERAVLLGALAALKAGKGGCALIEGPPGSGKTRLLEEVAAVAGGSGVTVLRVRADELDQYAPLAALSAAVAAPEDDRGPRRPAPPGGAAEDQRLWLLDHIADVLERRSQRAPLAVLVDDAQWADPATLFALGTLPGRLAASPVLWVVTLRPGDDRAPVGRMQAHLLAQPGTHRLVLSALPSEEVDRIAVDVLGAPPPPWLARLLREAGGNAFLTLELLRARRDGGMDTVMDTVRGPASGGDVPAALRRTLRTRMSRLPEETVRLLQIGSVLGRRFDLTVAARMLGRPVGALLGPVDAALHADVLGPDGDRFAFRHDLVRQALYDDLPSPVRHALHGQAAEVLLAAGRRSAETAWHLVLAGAPLDEEALGVLRGAVRDLASTAPEAAADLLLEAARLLRGDAADRIGLLTEAAHLLGWTRRLREALDLIDATLFRRPPPGEEAGLRLVAAEIHLSVGENAEAEEHLRRALELPDLPGELRVLLLKTRGHGRLQDGEVEDAERAGRELIAAARRSTDPAVLVSADLFESQVAHYRGRSAEAVRLAEAAVHRAAAVPDGLRLRPPRVPALWLATVLAGTDRLPEAERLLRRGQRQAETSAAGWTLPYWHATRACVLLERGRPSEAGTEAEACLSVAEELDVAGAVPVARAVLALTALASGDLAQASRHVAAAEDEGRRHTAADAAWVAFARACLMAAAEDPATAVEALEGVYGRGDPAPLRFLTPGHWPRIVRLALRAGDRPLAEAVGKAVTGMGQTDSGESVLHAVQAHVTGLLTDDREALATAVGFYRRAGRPLALAGACQDLADALAARGGGAAAVAYLEEARRLATASGATGERDRIEDRLGALRGRVDGGSRVPPTHGWESLTEAELRVVDLVAEGLTNRAIAERLYLSVHTVNTHVRHVFTKLGINTRVELTRLAVEREGRRG
ncbi:AAA family ATPase [Streptomyces sp. NPDC004658]|uniref:helix-turn-helix transcriptional regulator n=1 Tax=Streptomyces sp. NPDC004658 TaxID=3154672 RepID=UPI00339E5CE8